MAPAVVVSGLKRRLCVDACMSAIPPTERSPRPNAKASLRLSRSKLLSASAPAAVVLNVGFEAETERHYAANREDTARGPRRSPRQRHRRMNRGVFYIGRRADRPSTSLWRCDTACICNMFNIDYCVWFPSLGSPTPWGNPTEL
jgi:hypothetical protein